MPPKMIFDQGLVNLFFFRSFFFFQAEDGIRDLTVTGVQTCALPILKYLRLDHVDLLSLHGINNAELLDWSLRKGGCLDEARKIQREGRCRFIGFSTHATDRKSVV